jgi:hypothetical protein
MKKASQDGGIPKNVYTVPYLIYAYGVPETTFKRWRKAAKNCVNHSIDNAKADELIKAGQCH